MKKSDLDEQNSRLIKLSNWPVLWAIVCAATIIWVAVYSNAPLLGTAGSPTANSSEAAFAVVAGTDMVNINSAPAEELMVLPGIGETRAQEIVRYRTQHGPFETPEQLLEIKGIGPQVLEGLKPYIIL